MTGVVIVYAVSEGATFGKSMRRQSRAETATRARPVRRRSDTRVLILHLDVRIGKRSAIFGDVAKANRVHSYVKPYVQCGTTLWCSPIAISASCSLFDRMCRQVVLRGAVSSDCAMTSIKVVRLKRAVGAGSVMVEKWRKGRHPGHTGLLQPVSPAVVSSLSTVRGATSYGRYRLVFSALKHSQRPRAVPVSANVCLVLLPGRFRVSLLRVSQ
jgi:hypothetical protein